MFGVDQALERRLVGDICQTTAAGSGVQASIYDLDQCALMRQSGGSGYGDNSEIARKSADADE